MIYVILFLALLAVIVLPQFWVKRTIAKYNKEHPAIPGTGAEFAKHLLDKLELSETVSVETTENGDHYDSQAKAVRLSKAIHDKKSITAVVIAAHEVGHAIQDAEKNTLLLTRHKLALLATIIEKVAPPALMIAPLVLAITKSPVLSGVFFFIAFLSIATTSLFHFVTLPVELDASFQKAMPLLKEGKYLGSEEDNYQAAHQILKAAALTYVAQSLYNLLNIGYWLRALRR